VLSLRILLGGSAGCSLDVQEEAVRHPERADVCCPSTELGIDLDLQPCSS
jgi:hypothetical protein